MEKAYDLKALAEKMKSKGLDLAEEGAKIAVVSMLEWLEESAVKSENKYDDLSLAVLPLIKPAILKEIDKIDGQVG
jgi:hypothetical protein